MAGYENTGFGGFQQPSAASLDPNQLMALLSRIKQMVGSGASAIGSGVANMPNVTDAAINAGQRTGQMFGGSPQLPRAPQAPPMAMGAQAGPKPMPQGAMRPNPLQSAISQPQFPQIMNGPGAAGVGGSFSHLPPPPGLTQGAQQLPGFDPTMQPAGLSSAPLTPANYQGFEGMPGQSPMMRPQQPQQQGGGDLVSLLRHLFSR